MKLDEVRNGHDPMLRAVWAVGITEIIAWGTTIYALGVLGRPISEDTGWSQSLVFGGITTALVVSALLSTAIGRLIDRHGGRIVMTAGSVLAAAGLATVALAAAPWVYFAGWLLMGPAIRMILYDSAFAAIVQVVPSRGRRAISYLTLFGGLASTVIWLVGYWLEGAVGWRGTLIVFAALNLLVSAPLSWWGLARRESEREPDQPGAPLSAATHPDAMHPALTGRPRRVAMALFALALACNAFVFGALSVHLVTVLEATGLALGAAVTIAALKGVAQVAGRLWELTLGYRLPALRLGRLAIGLLPASLAVLVASTGGLTAALVFTLLLGVSNGLVTIVRGAVPLALFGREGYGALLGVLAAPQLFMNALAPFAYAAIVERHGAAAGVWTLLAVAVVSIVAMEATTVWVERARLHRVGVAGG